jgi:hypothetical protein
MILKLLDFRLRGDELLAEALTTLNCMLDLLLLGPQVVLESLA